jgi:hypothetical protein
VPRWSTYAPPFALTRVLLPESLTPLADTLRGVDVHICAPASPAQLADAVRGAACVLDPAWITELRLTLHDLENLAQDSWLLIDLATLAHVLAAAGAADVQVVTRADPHGLMSARVEYADVPTRGLALQDVVPYATLDDRGRFWLRGVRADRHWRAYADQTAFVTLLSSETPWARKHGDVLSAMRAVGRGELIATDLPWLVAGRHGPLVAPQLAEHLLRMHLGAPLDDHLQFWTRWDAPDTTVRDIADLPRRYPPLRTARWAATTPGVAHLGITCMPVAERITRHVMLCSGRIDPLAVHDGLPPEPMMILMKWLAREVREQTAWARQYLRGTAVTWQFDTAGGLKYAANYTAALSQPAPEVVPIRLRMPRSADEAGNGPTIVLSDDEGLHGDRALAFQDTLIRHVRRVLAG